MSEPPCPELAAIIDAISIRDLVDLGHMGAAMPESCSRVMHALCIMLKVTPEKHTETFPPGSGKKPVVHLLWGKCAQNVLSAYKLRNFSPDLLSDAQREELGKVAVSAELLTGQHPCNPPTHHFHSLPAGSC